MTPEQEDTKLTEQQDLYNRLMQKYAAGSSTDSCIADRLMKNWDRQNDYEEMRFPTTQDLINYRQMVLDASGGVP
jgi:hypothetical protein